MSWGVYVIKSDIHVIPCTKSGVKDSAHIFDDICICDPVVRQKEFCNKRIIVHKGSN